MVLQTGIVLFNDTYDLTQHDYTVRGTLLASLVKLISETCVVYVITGIREENQ